MTVRQVLVTSAASVEFLLRKGDKAKSLEFYQEALAVDPNFANAAAARGVVRKLSEELAQKK